MNTKDSVDRARKSFAYALTHQKYIEILKDDRHLELLLGMTDGKAGDTILDIGTGNGYLAFPLAELNPHSNIIGIDIAESIIEKNNALAKEKGISNLRFLAFDGTHYPFAAASIDLAVTRYAFHHFPQIEDTVGTIAGILKSGGHILVADPLKHSDDVREIIDAFMGIKKDGHIRFYTEAELESLFAGFGLAVERRVKSSMYVPFPPKQEYVALFEQITQAERDMYGLEIKDGVVWVNFTVGNTLFVKG